MMRNENAGTVCEVLFQQMEDGYIAWKEKWMPPLKRDDVGSSFDNGICRSEPTQRVYTVNSGGG